MLNAAITNSINYTPTNKQIPISTSNSKLPASEIGKSLTTWNVSDILQGTVMYKPQGLVYNSFNDAMSKSLSTARNVKVNGNLLNVGSAQRGLMGYDTIKGMRIDISTAANALATSANSTGTSASNNITTSAGGEGSGPGTDIVVPPTGKSWQKGVQSIDDVARLVIEVGIREDAQAVLVAIANRESNFNSMSSNQVPPDNSWGLWQINTINGASPQYRHYDLTDPYTNAVVMAEMSGGGENLHPWVTQRDGSNEPNVSAKYNVQNFMSEAQAAVNRVKAQGYRAG